MNAQPTILAANLGMADTLILLVLALVVFGPRRLPGIGRQIGKLMYEFRKASNDFRFQMEEELRTLESAEKQPKPEAVASTSAELPSSTAAEETASTTEPSVSSEVQAATASSLAGEGIYPTETAAQEEPYIPEYQQPQPEAAQAEASTESAERHG